MLRHTTSLLLRSRPSSRCIFNARNVQTSSNPKPLTGRLLNSPYLLAGICVWTGLSAYFLYPSIKKDIFAASNPLPLSPSQFSPALVLSSEITSKNTRLLTLAVTPPKDAPLSPIWSISIKDNDIQVERPYTPLEGIDEKGRIKLWIKKYPNGEVGRWLHSKNPGDIIEIRGPLTTWPWKEDAWDEIIMVCPIPAAAFFFFDLSITRFLEGLA
jgi:cytochrome-b5 reductase